MIIIAGLSLNSKFSRH